MMKFLDINEIKSQKKEKFKKLVVGLQQRRQQAKRFVLV